MKAARLRKLHKWNQIRNLTKRKADIDDDDMKEDEEDCKL